APGPLDRLEKKGARRLQLCLGSSHRVLDPRLVAQRLLKASRDFVSGEVGERINRAASDAERHCPERWFPPLDPTSMLGHGPRDTWSRSFSWSSFADQLKLRLQAIRGKSGDSALVARRHRRHVPRGNLHGREILPAWAVFQDLGGLLEDGR